MDDLGRLEKKLEEVISLVKSLGAEDRVQAGIIWNDFSAQMQMIINSTIETEGIISGEDGRLDEIIKTSSCRLEVCATEDETSSSLSQSSQGDDCCSSAEIGKCSEVDGNPTSITTTGDNESHSSLKNNGDESNSLLTIGGVTEDDVEEINTKETSSFIVEDKTSSDVKNKWVCDICSESLESETELKRHLKLSHKKTFKCNECDASFSKKGNLNVHKRKHTGDRPFPCPKCTNRFTTSGNLRRHLLSHQGLKPYSCSHCQARFTEKRNLLIHVRTHTGEKPYECPVCHKKFAHSSVLAQHQSIHKNLKPHLCHQCGKSFTQKSQLKVHEKRHSGVKSHVCQFCDSSFTTRSDLLRHQKTHTGEKPFVCNQCGKSFARSYTLKDHLNTKHPVEQNQVN